MTKEPHALLPWLIERKTHPSHAPANEVCEGGRFVGPALTGFDRLAETKARRSGGAWKRFVKTFYVFAGNLPSWPDHWALVEVRKRPRKKKRNMAVSL